MKKPALNRTFPPDRALVDAMVENMEIVTGRRNNKIAVPTKRTLTFSGTPTKAECEALYAYTNAVRDALAAVLSRLDT